MPSSRPVGIPTVLSVIQQLRPQSILDVGMGFGKWGVLFREYTDIGASGMDPNRYPKSGWQVRIDGVEAFVNYINPMQEYVYDTIRVGLVQDLADDLPQYDVIFMGDVIEHLPLEEGRGVLAKMVTKANKAVVVSTPKYDTHQHALSANTLEEHLSVWTKKEFKRFPGANVRTVGSSLLVAVILKPGLPVPRMRPDLAGLPETSTLRGLVLRLPEAGRRVVDRLRAPKPARARGSQPGSPSPEDIWRT